QARGGQTATSHVIDGASVRLSLSAIAPAGVAWVVPYVGLWTNTGGVGAAGRAEVYLDKASFGPTVAAWAYGPVQDRFTPPMWNTTDFDTGFLQVIGDGPFTFSATGLPDGITIDPVTG